MNNIYQIYYLEKQKKILDPSFIPYDNTPNTDPEWREYHVFRSAYSSGLVKPNLYTGFLSWKFNEKAQISGLAFQNFIKDNPGYDVYFINPFPHEVSLFKNMWTQGEFCHPGIIDFSQKLFSYLGHNIDLKSTVHSHKTALYCNFWVGSKQFWDAYMAFCEPFYTYIRTSLTESERNFVNTRADKVTDSNYIPYIFERLFTSFLDIYPNQFRALGWEYPEQSLQKRYGQVLPYLKKCDTYKDLITTKTDQIYEQFYNDYCACVGHLQYNTMALLVEPLTKIIAKRILKKFNRYG